MSKAFALTTFFVDGAAGFLGGNAAGVADASTGTCVSADFCCSIAIVFAAEMLSLRLNLAMQRMGNTTAQPVIAVTVASPRM